EVRKNFTKNLISVFILKFNELLLTIIGFTTLELCIDNLQPALYNPYVLLLCKPLEDFTQTSQWHWTMARVFPENVARNGIEMLKKIDFYKYLDKYTFKNLRHQISVLSKNIGIRKYKCPHMIKLVKHYVEKLCLPADVAIFPKHLINLLSPRFEIRATVSYPNYKTRAMVYIIYVLFITIIIEQKCNVLF
ncbi:hypothetical protein GQX74_009670, partial [Glossina fuscipes]